MHRKIIQTAYTKTHFVLVELEPGEWYYEDTYVGNGTDVPETVAEALAGETEWPLVYADETQQQPRFIVNPFGSKHYGEDPLYGWRVVDTQAQSPYARPHNGFSSARVLAVFPSEEQAYAVCATLNTYANTKEN